LTTPAIFLDRDGTLIEEAGYLDRLERISVFPWTIDALRVLGRAGFRLIVVSNQAGVAKGMFDEAFVRETHRVLAERFAAGGARIDGFYYCPHFEEGSVEAYRRACDCRKPKPGMLRQAAREHDLDLGRSFVVGDRWSDVEAAQAAGARGVLVKTGYGVIDAAHPKAGVEAARIAETLMDATTFILQEPRRCA
jgi:D-glycero-D-manno-heptose 1,7-bisphosphate phosphatase